jgi:hypothetical protein
MLSKHKKRVPCPSRSVERAELQLADRGGGPPINAGVSDSGTDAKFPRRGREERITSRRSPGLSVR